MGHLINPTAIRLSYFNDWIDVWITKEHFLYAEILHNVFDFKKILNFFFENLLIEKYGIIYSHFTVEVNNMYGFLVKCFFYDGVSEQKIDNLLKTINVFNKETYVHYKFVLRRFKLKHNLEKKSILLKKWKYYDYLLIKKIILFITYLLTDDETLTLNVRLYIKSFFFENYHKIWKISLIIFKKKRLTNLNTIKLYLNLLRKNLIKKFFVEINCIKVDNENLFNFNILISILHLTDIIWSRYQRSFRIFFLKNLTHNKMKIYLDYGLCVDRYVYFFFSSFYRLYLIWFRQMNFFKYLNKIIKPYLTKIGLMQVKLEFFGISNDTITACFLTRFLIKKLEMKFKLIDLFTPISNDLRILLENSFLIEGYKLQFIGRLSRRDRVRTVWLMGGKLPLTSVTEKIEHSMNLGVLKNGICCVRVWLFKTKSSGNLYNLYKYKLHY